MGTKTHYWSAATGTMFLANEAGVSGWRQLSEIQQEHLAQVWGLWDDVSALTTVRAVDNVNLARDSVTWNWWGSYDNDLPNDWTRIAVGTLTSTEIGLEQDYGENGRYHEIYIDPAKNQGGGTFAVGSQAFDSLLHEVGHAIGLNYNGGIHLERPSTETVMASKSQTHHGVHASTPMSADIDAAIALYGASTNTRVGSDTYGYNAQFSGAYRSAFDFKVNTKPLVTIYDNGGIDTLDMSGEAGRVKIDLAPGASSQFLFGDQRTFAVIYKTTEIENAKGGGGDDELFGNHLRNNLSGNDGHDKLFGNGGADVLMGGGGNDVLNGGADNDDMYGGIGNDEYMVEQAGDRVFDEASASGGEDKIFTTLNSYNMAGYGKGEWVENLQFVGTGSFAGHGNSLKNTIVGGAGWDTLYGYGNDDWLFGGDSPDWLIGGSGNDVLDGEGGADFLYGGLHDDHYRVGEGDQVYEYANEGTDAVFTKLSTYTLTANVEHLIFEDTATGWVQGIFASHTGFGNALNNVMRGSQGWETLYGYGGDDHFDGGRGNDTIYGGANTDTAFYSGLARDYVIKAGAIGTNSFTIRNKASGETDKLFEVEFAQFGDTRVALNWTNKAPDVAVTNKTLMVNEWQKVGDWIKATDGDGDAVTQYRFWDGGTGATSGYFWTSANAHHASGTTITVNASDLGNVWFRGGQAAGAETLWVQSFDGLDWGAWKPFTATTQAPIVNQIVDGTKFWGGTVIGGAGNDTVTYASAGHAIKVDLNAGRADGAGKTAQITSIENVTGALNAKNELIGDTKANTLIGGNLDDYLAGGGGADVLLGGKGNDSISYHNGVARIDGGEGFDYLLADESTDATGINFKVLGTNIEYVGGRYGHDIVDARGISYGITTSTYSGNDTFFGSDHTDVFQADAGIDTFIISGKRADYTITQYGTDGSWWLVTDKAGVWDAINNVEIVKFSDATLKVSDFVLL